MSIKTNTVDFISRAKEVHGEKYNYDKVVYVLSSDKVTITCPIHGDFEQRPYAHVNLKQNCPECAKLVRNQSISDAKYNKTSSRYTNDHGRKYRITNEHGTLTHWISDTVNSADVNASYGFVYMITNLVTMQKYIGKRRVKKYTQKTGYSVSNWATYAGSGKNIKEQVKTFGKDNFAYEILYTCNDKESLNKNEIELIAKNDARNSAEFLNIV